MNRARSTHPRRREWQVSAASDGGTSRSRSTAGGRQDSYGGRGVSGRPPTPAGVREPPPLTETQGPGELAGSSGGPDRGVWGPIPPTLRGWGFFPGGGGSLPHRGFLQRVCGDPLRGGRARSPRPRVRVRVRVRWARPRCSGPAGGGGVGPPRPPGEAARAAAAGAPSPRWAGAQVRPEARGAALASRTGFVFRTLFRPDLCPPCAAGVTPLSLGPARGGPEARRVHTLRLGPIFSGRVFFRRPDAFGEALRAVRSRGSPEHPALSPLQTAPKHV